jgi:hypothetical protein
MSVPEINEARKAAEPAWLEVGGPLQYRSISPGKHHPARYCFFLADAYGFHVVCVMHGTGCEHLVPMKEWIRSLPRTPIGERVWPL